MSISIHPELETKLQARAEAQGISVEAYLERMVRADESATDELERLALEALDSGEPFEPGPDYWQEKHRRLEARLKNLKDK